MSMEKSGVSSQAGWSVLLQVSRFAGNAIVFLAMARFLTIEEIGAFGMAFAPIRWTQSVHKAGIAYSVVATLRQRSSKGVAGMADECTFAALFWLSLGLSLVIMLSVGLLAFLLHQGGDQGQPVSEMMLAMLVVPLAFGLAAVPEGLLQKRLEVRSLALRTVTVQLISALLSVVLAIKGAGAWALVGFAILNAVLSSVISIVMANWWPRFGPQWTEIRAELPQTMTIAWGTLVAGGTLPLMQFSIGLFLGLEASGAFQIAQRIYQILDALCLAPIRFLVLPLFARAREENAGVLPGRTVLKGLRIAGAVTAPFYLGMIVIAEPALMLIIDGENATRSVLPLQILCLVGLNRTVATILTQAATAAGRPDIPMWRSMATLGLTAILGFPGLYISPEAVIIGFVLAAYITMGGYVVKLSKVFDLTKSSILGAVNRPYLAGFLSALPMISMEFFPGIDIAILANIAIGATCFLLYVVFLRFLAPESWAELKKRLIRKARTN